VAKSQRGKINKLTDVKKCRTSTCKEAYRKGGTETETETDTEHGQGMRKRGRTWDKMEIKRQIKMKVKHNMQGLKSRIVGAIRKPIKTQMCNICFSMKTGSSSSQMTAMPDAVSSGTENETHRPN
jgi:uncharacterized protein YydD (DUF2326 family)